VTRRLTSDQYWEDRPARATYLGLGAGWLIVVAIIILGGLIALALWAFGVFTSPVAGRANAFKQQQSAGNRIFAQQHFETLYGDIKAADKKLTQAQADVKANPGDRYYQTNYDGLVNLCNDDVAAYNQDASKYLLKDFRTADLPQQITGSDPTTDCQP
jgi:hypothetical protein